MRTPKAIHAFFSRGRRGVVVVSCPFFRNPRSVRTRRTRPVRRTRYKSYARSKLTRKKIGALIPDRSFFLCPPPLLPPFLVAAEEDGAALFFLPCWEGCVEKAAMVIASVLSVLAYCIVIVDSNDRGWVVKYVVENRSKKSSFMNGEVIAKKGTREAGKGS